MMLALGPGSCLQELGGYQPAGGSQVEGQIPFQGFRAQDPTRGAMEAAGAKSAQEQSFSRTTQQEMSTFCRSLDSALVLSSTFFYCTKVQGNKYQNACCSRACETGKLNKHSSGGAGFFPPRTGKLHSVCVCVRVRERVCACVHVSHICITDHRP